MSNLNTLPKPVIMRLKPAQQDHVLVIKKLYQDNIMDLQVWLQEALNHCVWGQLGESCHRRSGEGSMIGASFPHVSRSYLMLCHECSLEAHQTAQVVRHDLPQSLRSSGAPGSRVRARGSGLPASCASVYLLRPCVPLPG